MSLRKALLENNYKTKKGEINNYLKIPIELIKYLDDSDLSIYFAFLCYRYKAHKKKNPELEWFYILPDTIENFLPSSIFQKSKRTRLDKKLEALEIIKTKRTIRQTANRKLYKIKWKNVERACIKNETTCFKNGKPLINTNKEELKNTSKSKDLDDALTASQRKYETEKLELQGNRPLRYRRLDDIARIISFWSSKGKPFAKVRAKSSAREIIKEHVGRSRIHLGLVLDSINVGHNIYKHPDFIFASDKSISISTFFIPLKKRSLSSTKGSNQKFALLNNSKFKIMDELLPARKKRSWFNLFLFKTPLELERRLLHGIPNEDLAKDNYYQAMLNCIPHLDIPQEKLNSYKTTKKLYKISRLMREFEQANNVPVTNDILWFLEDNPGMPLHYLLSRNFWNNRFGNYITENLSRVKTIKPI